MSREGFHKRIKELEQDLMELGEMVIAAINRSVEALKNLDARGARRVVDGDAQVNKKRWALEDKCVDLIATQQPVASDLREIIAVLSIVRDLERIGDYAEGIGKIVLLHGDQPLVKPLVYIPQMAEKAVSMLRRSLDSHGAPDRAALDAGLSMLRDSDLRPLLQGIALPTLVIAGDHDRLTPPTAGRALAAAMPSARLRLIERSGHAPFLSHGPVLAGEIRAFLARRREALPAAGVCA